jgi:protein gp37
VFVNSMSDLFHEALPNEAIDKVFAVMAMCPQHTFQVLTKRPERMLVQLGTRSPLPNVWLGVSVEDKATADERIPLLLQTPAAIRFVSYEPALAAINLEPYLVCVECAEGRTDQRADRGDVCSREILDWVIAGGESGPNARPAHPDWFRSVRDQCQAAGVPFFFKQWGEWVPASQVETKVGTITHAMTPDGRYTTCDCESMMALDAECRQWEGLRKVGKKAAGRLLDGREWNEFPTVKGQQWQ